MSSRRTSPRKRLKETQSSSKPPEVFFAKRSSSQTTTKKEKNLNEDDNTKDDESLKLLEEWVSHNNATYHHFQPKEAQEIRQALLDWYRINRRKLPWRGDLPPYDGSTAANKPNTNAVTNTTNAPSIPVSAYGIWISEIMCQQTRVAAVVPYWLKWMESFPTVQDLANATEEQVNSHWAGLGFYRRARLLHQAAKHMVQHCNGQVPNTVDELMKIPGIGRYTASAIASIAFGVCVPVVDGNVCRVLSRLTGIANHIKAPVLKDKLGWDLAQQIVQAGDGLHAGDVNQAMMELGATHCAPSFQLEGDPLRDYYKSTQLGAAYYTYHSQQQAPKKLQTGILNAKSKPSTSCALCQSDGISVVLDQLEDAMEDASDNNGAQACGHGVFPIAPPKKSKREEVLAVAVLSCTLDKETYWLLVKRPKKGLLAGQWEFPSSCVWNSAGVKRKAGGGETIEVPSIAPKVRQEAIADLLDDILSNDVGLRSQINGKIMKKLKGPPLEHIFSHVRHTYAIECGSTTDANSEELSWASATGRDVRWMRQSDMKQAGVTSGVRKILKAVQEEGQKTEKRQGFFAPKKSKK